jgi:hypothetical protein
MRQLETSIMTLAEILICRDPTLPREKSGLRCRNGRARSLRAFSLIRGGIGQLIQQETNSLVTAFEAFHLETFFCD